MNLVILIMIYLGLWVTECFLKLSCLSQFLGCKLKNLTKEKLRINCGTLKKLIQN